MIFTCITFANLCLHQEKFKCYQCSFWVSLVFVLTWSRDPNNLLKSYVHIGNIDLHKCGDFHKVLRKYWKAVDNFMFEPRFHAVIYTWHFQPHINPVWTSYKVATKTFHVIQGPLNTFRLVACFLHEIPTGLYFMTFAAGLVAITSRKCVMSLKFARLVFWHCWVFINSLISSN